MSGVLIHDGRRVGHRRWSVDAIRTGCAAGVVLSPFATPRIAQARHPSARTLSTDASDAGGEVIFDAMTHARLLPTTNKVDFYDQWELWGSGGTDLSSTSLQLEHIERVFARQDGLGAARLAPTLQLSSTANSDAYQALDIGRVARGLDAGCWQSLVGTRAFWASGSALDAFVGSLVTLRAPVWVITVANELVVDHTPDLSNVDAFVGLARTVRSLSLRSRVIVAYADFAGLPAIAAGANTVGSGWDRAQKTFDPLAFKLNSDAGIRIPASYVTQGALNAVLRRDAADAIDRRDPIEARTIRGGAMPRTDQEQRVHHLQVLSAAVRDLDAKPNARDRVQALRDRYSAAQHYFDALITDLPTVVKVNDKLKWNEAPSGVLEAFALAEGL